MLSRSAFKSGLHASLAAQLSCKMRDLMTASDAENMFNTVLNVYVSGFKR